MRIGSLIVGLWIVCGVVGVPPQVLAASPGVWALKASSTAPAASETPEARVGRMTDAEARAALIGELAASSPGGQGRAPEADFLTRLEAGFTQVCRRMIALGGNLTNLPGDLAAAAKGLTGGNPPLHLFWMILMVVPFYGVGYAVEIGSDRWFRSLLPPAKSDAADRDGWKRLVEGLLVLLPELFGLVLFAVVAALLFLLVFGETRPHLRLFMLTFLWVMVVVRLAAIVSGLILAPGKPHRRLAPLDDGTAAYLHRWAVRIVALYALMRGVTNLLDGGGMPPDSLRTVVMGFGTAILLVLAGLVWANRRAVARAIRGDAAADTLSYRFADSWHAFALAYLFLIWLFGFTIFAVLEQKVKGAFVMSLLIVPIYLAMDRMGLWLVDAVVESFRQPSPIPKPKTFMGKPASEDDEEPTADESPHVVWIRKGARLIVFLAVAFWFLDIWGVGIAFAGALAGAAFSVFLTVLVAYLVWVWASRAIDRRILKSMRAAEPEDPEKEEDEWGGAAAQDRFYTLLPLFRKSLATVLVVMVALITLSAVGINIGPLLAGAGVVGLAIGFGAQRLVRDILSGIFFLMDDTFRIGEYVELGSVSGTVEELTLRLVKLRHHRGMLQFVPYGDIKQVTNSMRGGIVVKFNLEFPCETDIDLVRRVVKKVGQQMLDDPEFATDFIKPIKSQGVREIADAIMTIRVKFTAKPGAHFVIRREAYRRITEALMKKGIHYATRKFTVDLPKVALRDALVPRPAAEEAPSGPPPPPLPTEAPSPGGARN